MKQLSSADFRKAYASESEPIEVTSYGKSIGVWYPAGCDLPEVNPIAAEPVSVAAPIRMTIRPVKESKRAPLVGTEKRIMDPIERGKREREMWSQLSAKMNSKSDSRSRR